jgi:hypothetical protein
VKSGATGDSLCVLTRHGRFGSKICIYLVLNLICRQSTYPISHTSPPPISSLLSNSRLIKLPLLSHLLPPHSTARNTPPSSNIKGKDFDWQAVSFPAHRFPFRKANRYMLYSKIKTKEKKQDLSPRHPVYLEWVEKTAWYHACATQECVTDKRKLCKRYKV